MSKLSSTKINFSVFDQIRDPNRGKWKAIWLVDKSWASYPSKDWSWSLGMLLLSFSPLGHTRQRNCLAREAVGETRQISFMENELVLQSSGDDNWSKRLFFYIYYEIPRLTDNFGGKKALMSSCSISPSTRNKSISLRPNMSHPLILSWHRHEPYRHTE